MQNNRVTIKDESEIPESVLCTFGRKMSRGIHYFVGYRKGDKIHTHFSMKRYDLNVIISYQYVISEGNRMIKK